jgi:DNA mismatch repair ATPase MutS
VPGTQARISPVDRIDTHFPVEELLERGTGRFGDEAQRLSEIFASATRHSLILLNESLSSTSAGESLYLAQDLMRVLRRLGGRVVFATHLHELAHSAESLNADTPGDSRIISIVASRVHEDAIRQDGAQATLRRSYKIAPGPPIGRSYARELAANYGISYDQLLNQLRERGQVD